VSQRAAELSRTRIDPRPNRGQSRLTVVRVGGNVKRPLFVALIPLLVLAVLLSPSAGATGGNRTSLVSPPAVGNPNPARYIISYRIPGWVAYPPTRLAPYISSITDLENTSFHGLGVSVETAARGWHDRGSTAQSLFIFLLAFSGTPHGSSLGQLVAAAVNASIDSVCEGATGSPAVSILPLPSIPGGRLGRCAGSGVFPPEVAVFGRANILALGLSKGATPETVTDALAMQFRALQKTTSPG